MVCGAEEMEHALLLQCRQHSNRLIYSFGRASTILPGGVKLFFYLVDCKSLRF